MFYSAHFKCFVSALLNGLKRNFSEVNVEVVDCPDLSIEPFNLACKGKIHSFVLLTNIKMLYKENVNIYIYNK